MTRKTVKHDYSDEHITQCEIGSTNNDGNNDFAILHTKYDFKRYKLGLTMADLKMTLNEMGYEITRKQDIVSGGVGLPGHKGVIDGVISGDGGSVTYPIATDVRYKAISDPRLMENKTDIISGSVDENGITTVKIKRDEQ